MYQLFTKVFESNNAVIRPPEFELIRRTYQAQLLNILQYYHSRVYAVRSNHLLCRLLTTASIPVHYTVEQYLEVAYTRSPYVAKHFNFTSEINYGKIQPSVFYGESNMEIIVYNEDYFDAHEVIKDWQNIEAVRVLEHPFSDLGLLLPTGIEHSTDHGLVTMSINIPLLLLQYRCFLLEQMHKSGLNDTSLLGVSHFVHMYVLPNILHSHLQLCIVNRLVNLFYGAPMGEALKHHPFPIINYGDKIDKVLTTIVKRLEKTKMLYFSMLKNIPSVEYNDSQEALLMPDIAKTRQVWWALLVTRLRLMKFLLDVGDEQGLAMNRSFVNKLRNDLKRLLDENMLKSMLPKDMYFDIDIAIQQILKL